MMRGCPSYFNNIAIFARCRSNQTAIYLLLLLNTSTCSPHKSLQDLKNDAFFGLAGCCA